MLRRLALVSGTVAGLAVVLIAFNIFAQRFGIFGKTIELPANEVLGLNLGGEIRTYPLRRLGDAAVNDTLAGQRIVVFSSSDGPSGSVFRAMVDGRALTFAFRDGGYVDKETASLWDLSGRATAGLLKGERLEPLPSRYTFWFAFIAAFPETNVYTP